MNEVRRAAAEAGLPMPALSFVRTRDREWLQIGTGEAITLYDGIDAWVAGGTEQRWRIANTVDPDAVAPAEIEAASEMSELAEGSAGPESEGSGPARPNCSAPDPDHPDVEGPDVEISEPDSPDDETTSLEPG